MAAICGVNQNVVAVSQAVRQLENVVYAEYYAGQIRDVQQAFESMEV